MLLIETNIFHLIILDVPKQTEKNEELVLFHELLKNS